MKNRLIKTYSTTDCKTLDDFLLCMMGTIEDGLLQAGFTPGEDYTRKDLFTAVMPMVHKGFEDNQLSYTIGWPG